MQKKCHLFLLLAALSFYPALSHGAARNDYNTPEDIAQWQEDAETGNAEAQFKLGSAYQEGDGVHQNDIEACKWFAKAASQNNTDAETSLGFAYRGGFGVPRDLIMSYMWFDVAAKQNNEEAQNMRADVAEQMTYDEIKEARKNSATWLSQHGH